MTTPSSFRNQFVAFSAVHGALRFGEFKTKAGRLSPYFFNAGAFHTGEALSQLGVAFAHAILESGVRFDGLFGPAYKGIPLVAATAIALAQMGHNVPFSFNRKEAKDHGEGGSLVGAPLKGRILLLDDTVSAGTSVRESAEIVRAAGATLAGVVVALDRQERGGDAQTLTAQSATEHVSQTHGVPVVAIATLDDILAHVLATGDNAVLVERIQAYRNRYGVATLSGA
jgi:orotate phosphoribosyltransferase